MFWSLNPLWFYAEIFCGTLALSEKNRCNSKLNFKNKSISITKIFLNYWHISCWVRREATIFPMILNIKQVFELDYKSNEGFLYIALNVFPPSEVVTCSHDWKIVSTLWGHVWICAVRTWACWEKRLKPESSLHKSFQWWWFLNRLAMCW